MGVTRWCVCVCVCEFITCNVLGTLPSLVAINCQNFYNMIQPLPRPYLAYLFIYLQLNNNVCGYVWIIMDM